MKYVDLIFHREQLTNDIRNTAYIVARSLSEKEGNIGSDTTWLTDICEDGNIERVTRMLNLAYRKLEGDLHTFTKHPSEYATILDDTYGEPEHYSMCMHVPDDFTKNSVYLIKNLIHEILTYGVVREWCDLTHHSEGMAWLDDKITSLHDELNKSINRHDGYVLRKAHPLGL